MMFYTLVTFTFVKFYYWNYSGDEGPKYFPRGPHIIQPYPRAWPLHRLLGLAFRKFADCCPFYLISIQETCVKVILVFHVVYTGFPFDPQQVVFCTYCSFPSSEHRWSKLYCSTAVCEIRMSCLVFGVGWFLWYSELRSGQLYLPSVYCLDYSRRTYFFFSLCLLSVGPTQWIPVTLSLEVTGRWPLISI
jgi:hypothetical protein